jgi:hypothetical protein
LRLRPATAAEDEQPAAERVAAFARLAYTGGMRVTTGRVVAGRIEVPGEIFVEGQVVTVLAPEEDETFTLTPEAEAALLAAMAEGDRGDVVSAEELFRQLERDG